MVGDDLGFEDDEFVDINQCGEIVSEMVNVVEVYNLNWI